MPTNTEEIRQRLEAIRASLRAENVSYGELIDLQSLADHIAPGDTELLEAAGVPEACADATCGQCAACREATCDDCCAGPGETCRWYCAADPGLPEVTS